MFEFDISKTAHDIEQFIHQSCAKEHIHDVLIGVSGGVDSATCLTLATKALGATHVYPVLLPYGPLNEKGRQDALEIIRFNTIPKNNIRTIDIKPSTDAVVEYDTGMDDARKGNIMARMRMVMLFDLSKKLNYLVIGTENKSEHLLGYYTRFGDEASDIEPIQTLYKTQVFMLAQFLGIPEKIIKKAPSAGLWEGQTDEGEFGFSYKIADEILYYYEEKKKSKDEILQLGYDSHIVHKIWWWIEKGQFKDRVPYKIMT